MNVKSTLARKGIRGSKSIKQKNSRKKIQKKWGPRDSRVATPGRRLAKKGKENRRVTHNEIETRCT